MLPVLQWYTHKNALIDGVLPEMEMIETVSTPSDHIEAGGYMILMHDQDSYGTVITKYIVDS